MIVLESQLASVVTQHPAPMSRNTLRNMNMMTPLIVSGANGEPVAQTVAVESKKELLKSKPSMVEKNAQEKLNKTVLRNPVLSTVNGANGEPVAQTVAVESKKEL